MEPDVIMWKAVIGACSIHRKFEMGEKAGHMLLQLAPYDHSGYVCIK
jgi:hypothetical protein